MKPNELTPAQIRSEWDRVRPQLEGLAKGQDWRPEDVYAECLYGRAVLYTCPEGFVVLKELVNQYSGEKYLFIWVACGSGSVEGHTLINWYWPQISVIAQSVGANRVSFESRRNGYERVLGAEWSSSRRYERVL